MTFSVDKSTFEVLKERFISELNEVYEKNECKNIFHLCVEYVFRPLPYNYLLPVDIVLNDSQICLLENFLDQLKQSIPVQYVLGETEFYGLPFIVNKDVLIPRQETEILVDTILKSVKKNTKLSILDLGTGSGCIPVTLKKHLPDSEITAIDTSLSALRLAKLNARLNNVDIQFLNDCILTDCPGLQNALFDIIISNPPYVLNKEKKLMHKNVLEWEPELALFVEDDNPLLFYKHVKTICERNLKKGGMLMLEINEAFGKETAALFENSAFENVQIIRDLEGKDRFIKAVKASK